VNPQNEKLQVTNYQLQIAVPKPEASDNSKPAHQPSAIPSETEKSQVTNYKLQIAVPTSKPAENPPNEDTPAETPQNPKHETQNSQQTRVPISPLAFPGSEIPRSAVRTRKFNSQPQGTIPMFDVCGALVDWIPQSAPCPDIFDIVGFQNRRGKYICWVHPNDPYRDPANPEPNPRRTAILNVNGLIVGWLTGHPDPAKPPSPTAQPINSRRFRHGLVAWIDERA